MWDSSTSAVSGEARKATGQAALRSGRIVASGAGAGAAVGVLEICWLLLFLMLLHVIVWVAIGGVGSGWLCLNAEQS